jgi:inhibitor of cysteine peptidase
MTRDPRPTHRQRWPVKLLIAVACIAPFAAPAHGDESRSTIRLAAGARTVIELPENPSTGYGWRLNAEGSRNLALVSISDAGFAAGTASGRLVGAPGLRRFEIEARKEGTATAVFDYARPWEHVAPVRRYVVTIAISR